MNTSSHRLAFATKKFRDSVSAGDIEIGFPGEIIHKDLALNCCDLSQLPSAAASQKLNQLIAIRSKSRNSGSTTVLARLTHARLFGSDDPYVDRTPQDLMQEMSDLRAKYHHQDDHFLYESHAERVQVVVYNQGDEIAAYPSVVLTDDSIQISSKIGDIPVGEPVDVFASPLRLCVGKDLIGKRFAVRYALHGQNLRSPAKGRLRLLFKS